MQNHSGNLRLNAEINDDNLNEFIASRQFLFSKKIKIIKKLELPTILLPTFIR
jgi:hypothetical protein